MLHGKDHWIVLQEVLSVLLAVGEREKAFHSSGREAQRAFPLL